MSNPLKNTLPEPDRHPNIPSNSQWLSGEGAGSWFHLEQKGNAYYISRFSPEGNIECEGIFNITSEITLNITDAYEVTHLSHCQQVSVLQCGKTLVFVRN